MNEEVVEESAAEMALRSLACWLGVGGYNATSVDAKVFEERIREAVNDQVDFAWKLSAEKERKHFKEIMKVAPGKSDHLQLMSPDGIFPRAAFVNGYSLPEGSYLYVLEN